MSDLDFIEACYEEAPSEAEWGARLAERMALLVPEARVVLGASYVVDAAGLRCRGIIGDARCAAQPSSADAARRCAAALSGSAAGQMVLAKSYGWPRPHMAVVSDFPRDLGDPISSNLPWRRGDALGCFGSLDGRGGYFLGPAHPDRLRFSRHQRQQELGLATGTIGVHLAAALRKLGCPNRRALAQWLSASGGSAS